MFRDMSVTHVPRQNRKRSFRSRARPGLLGAVFAVPSVFSRPRTLSGSYEPSATRSAVVLRTVLLSANCVSVRFTSGDDTTRCKIRCR